MFGPATPHYETSVFVTTFGPESNADNSGIGLPSTAAWVAANRALYVPIVVPSACVIRKFFWANGTTASTNNVQIGIYTNVAAGPGDAILRGTSTTASGASTVQYDDVTDTPIGPGHYWLACWCNGTTTHILRSATILASSAINSPYLQDSLTGGLPTTATPVQYATGVWPLCGFTTA